MRLPLFLAIAAFVAASCAADDPPGAFLEFDEDTVVNETEELEIDLEALETAAEEPDEATADAESEGPPPIEIPDNALDFTAFESVALDIQDNAFTQRVVVVKAGTEITWTNQGRNEHNVRPSIEGAFEPISTLALAEKGDSASLTFDEPGDFPYFCSLHGTATRGQTGRVIVVP